ncbi:MAG: type I DNA topoisomerase [Rikenellaceae bacterium]
MADNIVIVESPAKAKTIEKILGKDFTVKSSFGHIRDLPSKGIGVDIENNFNPEYEVSPTKTKVVSELNKAVKESKVVWLASDEDREGEAIAWHLSETLNLKDKEIKRIVFHEITKQAIFNAIENPRDIDINLVNAQQARRILDRLVGFELSPVLWKKVRPSLSAGRVQSVAVRLIVDREREIINFKTKNYYRTLAYFTVKDENNREYQFKAELSERFSTKEEAYKFLEACKGSDFSVESIETKSGKRTPSAPFTTSTLQQEASRKLGFSVSQTMSVAQKLYEAGHITYMRTDSVNLSNEAVGAISSSIKSTFGDNYLQNRKFKTKSKGAQEAHEAIRPTYAANKTIDGTSQEKRLYDLIWKRAVASQMSDAIMERTTINISVSGDSRTFVAKGEVIKFDGFMRLYSESSPEDSEKEDSTLLPAMKTGDKLGLIKVESTERFQLRPARYSEASLVKHLEELGIGRPSTYAPTITTVISRGYVVKEDREGSERVYTNMSLEGGQITEQSLKEKFGSEKSKLFPTDTGILVNDYLSEHFPEILNYNFTANIEKSFDDIAEGNSVWKSMLSTFYAPFHETVVNATNEASYASSSNRLLGVDPASGKNVYARMGRFGAMVQIGESDSEEKPQYASIRQGQLLETITLEQALELFRLPRNVGEYEEKVVTIGLGRFGPYVRHDSKFTSLSKEDDPYTITLERAIELIEEKRLKDKNRVRRVFECDDKLQVLNGRYGEYIVYDGDNYKLPKGSEVDTMSYEQFMEIVKNSEPTSKKSTKKAAPKKAAPKKAVAKKATTAKKSTTTTRARKSTKEA